MNKPQVNIVKVIPFYELKSGQRYYYNSGKHISEGTVVFCENCGKACAVNSMTIKSFGKSSTNIVIADISNDELYYNDETDSCLCSDCG